MHQANRIKFFFFISAKTNQAECMDYTRTKHFIGRILKVFSKISKASNLPIKELGLKFLLPLALIIAPFSWQQIKVLNENRYNENNFWSKLFYRRIACIVFSREFRFQFDFFIQILSRLILSRRLPSSWRIDSVLYFWGPILRDHKSSRFKRIVITVVLRYSTWLNRSLF